jgi:hypothetical protein
MGFTTHWMGKKIPELMPEDEEIFVGLMRVPGSISRHVSTFSDFQFSVKPLFKNWTMVLLARFVKMAQGITRAIYILFPV